MDDLGLFDLPASAQPEPATGGARRRQLIEVRIANRVHPLGGVRLHADAAEGRTGPGLRCGTCRWRETLSHHNRSYPKCLVGGGVRVSHSEASDVRGWWPACRDYEPKEHTS